MESAEEDVCGPMVARIPLPYYVSVASLPIMGVSLR
jgi:hypothetical protein